MADSFDQEYKVVPIDDLSELPGNSRIGDTEIDVHAPLVFDIIDARNQVDDGIAAMLDYARQANMPLAIEPLHPAYAADRACVGLVERAL